MVKEVKQIEPYRVLLKMPSLRAVRCFVAAAKYQNFTRAAEALCVTQAAISRQIRELEASLGVYLFNRTGRAVELTEEGSIFYDAAYLSFVNIAQAADRIRADNQCRTSLTICCSPAFSTLCLSRRLPEFSAANPDVEINIISTSNFNQMEPGIMPDILINKSAMPKSDYHMVPLAYDIIYPVCTPAFLERNPAIKTLEGLKKSTLLNLSPYGRAQITEHVDWDVWFELQSAPSSSNNGQQTWHHFQANDFVMLMQMVMSHQGIALGWDYLIRPLVDDGVLIRPIQNEIVMKEKRVFLFYLANKDDSEPLCRFRDWLIGSME